MGERFVFDHQSRGLETPFLQTWEGTTNQSLSLKIPGVVTRDFKSSVSYLTIKMIYFGGYLSYGNSVLQIS